MKGQPSNKSPSDRSAFDRFYNHGHRPEDAIDLAISDAIHNRMHEFSLALIRYRYKYDQMQEQLRAVRQCVPELNRMVQSWSGEGDEK